MRNSFTNKKENAEKHLAELVDDPQIEVRFIKACEKQIEDAKRQLEKLDSNDSGGSKSVATELGKSPLISENPNTLETDSKDSFWNSYPIENLTPEQRRHYKAIMRKEVRSK